MDYSKLEKAKAEAKRFLEAAENLGAVDNNTINKHLSELAILRRTAQGLIHALVELRH